MGSHASASLCVLEGFGDSRVDELTASLFCPNRKSFLMEVPMKAPAAQYVVVIRHGQTIPNILLEQSTDSHFYEVTGSDETIGLTQLGFIQAREAALFLARLFRRRSVARIYCSQFFRTRSTAEVIQSVLPNSPQIVEDRRVAKRHYGDFWNITYNGVKALHPQEYQQFLAQGGYLYRPPAGENYVDLKLRLLDFVRDEIDSSDDNVVISTHSAAALMLEQLLLDEMTDADLVARYDEIAVPNASVIVYKRVAARRRIFGKRLDIVGWIKRFFGYRHDTWIKCSSFTPGARSMKVELADCECEQNQEPDSIIDKENRVA
jgi:2,3-bisphosphoglycerate-dependent phosphoglycerate mutase